jgi:hypothetical protein
MPRESAKCSSSTSHHVESLLVVDFGVDLAIEFVDAGIDVRRTQ